MFDLNKHLAATVPVKYRPRARLVCVDGFSVSAQASDFAYCSPRDDRGPWESVECGYPSEEIPEWAKWAEDKDNLTETVYGWVPVAVVEKTINDHGGIKD